MDDKRLITHYRMNEISEVALFDKDTKTSEEIPSVLESKQ